MMKLTVVVLLGLIGVAIALHGTGGYGNYGGYGNGGGKPGKDSSSSSESEEKGKKCKLTCTNNVVFPVFLDRVPTLHDCNSGNALGNALQCNSCCQGWGLQRGLEKDDVISHVDGEDAEDLKCICCENKCR
uniref:Uncharacterized protein n=1 Tax=Panagrolaimus sp. PS1159 TaxID=55785 RepID=A0AC35FEN4_9BILA